MHSALLKVIKPLLLGNNPRLHDWLGRWGLVTGPQRIEQKVPEAIVKITNKLLEKFREETDKRGDRLLVYIMPASIDLYPSYPESLGGYDQLVRARWLPRVDAVIDLHASYHARIVAYLDEASIPFVDGYVQLRQRAALGDLLYLSMLHPELPEGHFSALGHQRSAEAIFYALNAGGYL